ncbi:MAG: ExbD/TolR family protein [Planctomycetota bacterium]
MSMAAQQAASEGQQHYRSARQRRGSGKAKLQPPLAPMIDVTFQLLIFFLLTATFRSEGNIAYQFPPVGLTAATDTPVGTVNVVIYQHGEGDSAKPGYRVLVDNRGVAEVAPPSGELSRAQYNRMSEALYQVLVEQRAKGEEVPANVKPEGGFIMWKFVVETYNQTRRAGFEKVGIDISGV